MPIDPIISKWMRSIDRMVVAMSDHRSYALYGTQDVRLPRVVLSGKYIDPAKRGY
jgi:hypothetical protein